jgi:preprotein translocase subunit YajC
VQGNIFILAASSKSQSNPLGFLLPLILIGGAFYFFLIRPQRNRQRQQAQMQKNLEPGTRVVTTSGMYATIVEVNDDGVILELAPDVQVQFVEQAIMRVVEEDTGETEDDAEDDEENEDDAHTAPAVEAEPKTAPPSLVKSDEKTDKTDD